MIGKFDYVEMSFSDIAKKSVELLGGTIVAESEVGRGTTFTMKIGDYTPA